MALWKRNIVRGKVINMHKGLFIFRKIDWAVHFLKQTVMFVNQIMENFLKLIKSSIMRYTWDAT